MKKLILSLAILLATPFVTFAESDDVEFRRILNGYLKADGLSQEQIQQVIFTPPESLLISPDTTSIKDFISKIDQIGQQTNPMQVYLNSSKNKREESYNVNELTDRLRQTPLTIIVFPGIFGEFIPTHAFEEVFKKTDSAYAKEFKEKTDADKKGSRALHISKYGDSSYDLGKMTITDGIQIPQKNLPLDECFKVASIDDEKKNPLVKVVIFDTQPMSLETLGTMRENTERFTRRLEGFFRLMGTPENMVFIGYSRGTMTALDNLTFNKNKAWMKNVKAMISLGGVTYGTALADDALRPDSDTGKLITEVKKVLKSLENIDDGSLADDGFNSLIYVPGEVLARAKRNVERVTSLRSLLKDKDFDPKATIESIKGFGNQTKGTDIKSQIHLLVSVLTNLGLDFKNLSWTSLLKDIWSRDIFTIARNKFTVIFQSTLAAVEEMQTKKRLDWWFKSDLPLHVKYYAIAGTMGEGFTDSKMGFNPNTQDDLMLLGNYNDYKKASNGVLLNDSQVAVQRVKFWPELSAMLNPNNAGMNTAFLGIVGTHHWGLALEIVNANKDGSKNPFPRETLLKALATQVATDIQGK